MAKLTTKKTNRENSMSIGKMEALDEIKKEPSKKLNINIPESLHYEFKKKCLNNKTNMSDIIKKWINKYSRMCDFVKSRISFAICAPILGFLADHYSLSASFYTLAVIVGIFSIL